MILNLAWLIPAFPMLAFIGIAVGLYRSPKLSTRLAVGCIAAAGMVSLVVFGAAVLQWAHGHNPAGFLFESGRIPWLTSGTSVMTVGLYLDPVSLLLLFMVPLVCLMIFIYSIGYMHGDPRTSRFFAYISLFAAGMLGLVVFDSFLTLFIFWEIMGTCSYLLIGFWYEKPSARAAGLKAFLVTKVGDLFLLLGLVLLYSQVGSLHYRDVLAPETLSRLAATPFMGLNVSVATVAALLIFGGTVGKSAQFPLHVWLPDAMEGPTPVSALIHAATMVSAGVYLVIRAYPLFAVSEALGIVAFIGTFTACFAALIALAQDDIKRVLAFSTISQLGYMVAALGIGAYIAAVFHLITHAFFKALLFLASGSVIHGMEHGHHHTSAHNTLPHGDFNPNDMLLMGGLAQKMPFTAIAFLSGGLALSGFPIITAGFWSKDEILSHAWGLNRLVFWLLALSAALTAFYTSRQLCLTFLGKPRSPAAAHAPESVPSMTVPLLVLAFFALTLGWAGIPEHFPVIGGLLPNWFHHFVAGVPHSEHYMAVVESSAWQPLVISIFFAIGGLTAGWWVYGRHPLPVGASDPIAAALQRVRLGWVYQALQRRLYFDELYQATFVAGACWIADLFADFDQGAIDCLVNWAGRCVSGTSHLTATFDDQAIDGLVNGVGSGVGGTGQLTASFDDAAVDNLVCGVSESGCSIALLFAWFDTHVLDFFVNAGGWFGRNISIFSDLLDQGVVDRLVHTLTEGVSTIGHRAREVQNGLLQDYLWNALLMVLLLIAVLVLY
ncbi:MAG: NADH-quinone oxidoreductase subunit L [Anaerolineae bacterium]|nr:NADH-quinone oxidoreductase subunit L [Anaerolineae bacterium]